MRPRLSIATSRKPHEERSLHGLLERGFEHLGQVPAVHLAGERVEAREIGEPLLALVALVDRAHDAVRARRLAVGAGEPAAGILDPERIRVRRGSAQARIAPDRERRRPDRASPSASPHRSASVRLSDRRTARRPRPLAMADGIGECQHAADIGAPDEFVGVDPPVVRQPRRSRRRSHGRIERARWRCVCRRLAVDDAGRDAARPGRNGRGRRADVRDWPHSPHCRWQCRGSRHGAAIRPSNLWEKLKLFGNPPDNQSTCWRAGHPARRLRRP